MKTMVEKSREQIVQEALPKAITYQSYRQLMDDHAAQETSTGPNQTEALTNYTMLNQRRMKRLDKTTKIQEAEIAKIQNFKGDVTWLVITESWCGDAAQTMPVMQKIAELNDGIDVKVILRDENLELIDAFLYNGGRSIPKLVAIDNTSGNVLADWGPRPSEATKMVNDYKEAHGKLTPEFKQDLQVWYNKDKGQNTIEDLVSLLENQN
ncbi:thioredoxin [Dokdonia pacifica]|uniref:Thiol-disulfide isomerase or thioredoxin n=1 Tax=Dokdonia pacifica TaxID=1627892 RepID=A0A238W5I3_9FLAO|nr:thioredoxin family protein [Dokdonia pacifica]GGG14843.1 thioredoxin [Dokdonia pacifica]SNR41812.1 Thiol-disulfide isomerase or thioredoxin [Dokdonia pacifica]